MLLIPGVVCFLFLTDARPHQPQIEQAHSEWVTALAYAPDATTIWSAGNDKRLIVRSLKTGQTESSFALGSAVTALAATPDRTLVIAGCWDGTLHVFDSKRKKKLRSSKAHTEAITAITIGPQGKRFATASADDSLKTWELATWKLIHELPQGGEYDVTCVAVSPDGQWLVSGDGENNAHVVDMTTGEELLTLSGHQKPVADVVISPDGKHIITGSWDKTVRVWDSQTGGEQITLRGHLSEVTSVLITSDGKSIIAGSEDGTVRRWKTTTTDGRDHDLLLRSPRAITDVVCSPDGRSIAVSSWRTITLLKAPD